jgi:uncharacterized protein (DUF1800 family)
MLPEHASLRGWREDQAAAAALTDPQARRAAAQAVQARRRQATDALARAMLLRLVDAPPGSRAARDEWLAFFWFNHFNVFWAKDLVGAALPHYLDDTIRPRIRGAFAELLEAVVTHPAMLVYLDNTRNAAGRVNENLARELLELHTLGVDGGYDQADVQAVARLLTGFGLRSLREQRWPEAIAAQVRERGEFLFDPRRHDGGDRRVLGHAIAARGYDELPELCGLLAAQPATARHLARRLARFLIGDAVPASLVAEAARAFMAAGGRIDALLAVLEPAADVAPRGDTLKLPLRWLIDVVSLVADGREARDAAPLQRWLVALGQPLFGRTTPDGYPLAGSDWASSGQLVQRFQVARELIAMQGRIFGAEGRDSPLERSPAALLESPAVRAARDRLGASARAAIASAAQPADALALLLSSPEIMMR